MRKVLARRHKPWSTGAYAMFHATNKINQLEGHNMKINVFESRVTVFRSSDGDARSAVCAEHSFVCKYSVLVRCWFMGKTDACGEILQRDEWSHRYLKTLACETHGLDLYPIYISIYETTASLHSRSPSHDWDIAHHPLCSEYCVSLCTHKLDTPPTDFITSLVRKRRGRSATIQPLKVAAAR